MKIEKKDLMDYFIGETIRMARKRKGMSRIDLSIALNDYGIDLSEYTIKSYEMARTACPISVFFAIAKIFKLDINSIFSEFKKEFFDKE